MRRFISVTLFVMALVMMPSFAKAQNDGTFNRNTLKSTESTNGSKERRVDRKTHQNPAGQPVQNGNRPQVREKPSNGMEIINPCHEWLDFEFVKLVGSTSEQTMTLTFNFTNHDVNKRMMVGHDILAYDEDGGEHKCYGGKYFDAKTDVMISYTMDIPGEVLTSTLFCQKFTTN